jgi:hypothetical protein
MIMKKIVSVIVNGRDLVKSMHFVADDDAFDEVDCQYNDCQFVATMCDNKQKTCGTL